MFITKHSPTFLSKFGCRFLSCNRYLCDQPYCVFRPNKSAAARGTLLDRGQIRRCETWPRKHGERIVEKLDVTTKLQFVGALNRDCLPRSSFYDPLPKFCQLRCNVERKTDVTRLISGRRVRNCTVQVRTVAHLQTCAWLSVTIPCNFDTSTLLFRFAHAPTR